jgi:opacity protein-like surface antigen
LVSGRPLKATESQPRGWYGDGETTAFKRAMDGSESLTEAEEKRIKEMVPPKDYDRPYIRYNVAMSRKNLSGIINLSDSSYPQANAEVNEGSVRSNQRNSLFAIGYDWNPGRFDIEYVWTKSFTYSANPVFKSPAPVMTLNASISNKVLLANFYYDYRNFGEHIYPYALVSVGGVYNTVQTALTNPQAGRGLTPTTHNFSLAIGAGAGLRLGITRSLFFDVHYRYVKAGYINFRPEPAMYLRGNHSFYWYGLGLMYLL